jgi:hypothetical protein
MQPQDTVCITTALQDVSVAAPWMQNGQNGTPGAQRRDQCVLSRRGVRDRRQSRGIDGRPRNNSPRIRATRAIGAGGIIHHRAKTVIGAGQII